MYLYMIQFECILNGKNLNVLKMYFNFLFSLPQVSDRGQNAAMKVNNFSLSLPLGSL